MSRKKTWETDGFCLQCKRPFIPKDALTHYCSVKCAKKGNKMRNNNLSTDKKKGDIYE